MSCELPTPAQLATHPELASLHALQAALAATERALVTEHPPLQQRDFLAESPPLSVDTYFAEVVLRAIADLESAVSRYRDLLDRLALRRGSLLLPDDEF
jgi:hypothetical protein